MASNRNLLLGCWQRIEQVDDQNQLKEFAVLLEDGSYEFSFSIYNEVGELQEQSIERGNWGLVGDIHFTIAKQEITEAGSFMNDLANEDNYHAYRVLVLDKKIFKYQHIVSNEVFILERVIDKIIH